MKNKEMNPNNLILKSQYDKAREVIIKRLKDEPNNHWLLSQLSSVEYEELDYNQSLRTISKAYKLAPNCPLVIWHYGCTLSMLGKKRQAIIKWKKLIKIGIEKIAYEECGEGLPWARSLLNDCYYQMALAYYSIKNKSDAIKYLKLHIKNRSSKCKSIYHMRDVKKKLKSFTDS